jgi:signal transduction histidine kinase
VAQEAMHNALNHAHPTHVNCHVAAPSDGKHIVLTVQDDGTGFSSGEADSPTSSGHFGLKGMRERIEGLGGNLRIESTLGSGTCVCADVPLRTFDDELA